MNPVIDTRRGVPAPLTNPERAAIWQQRLNAARRRAGASPPVRPAAQAGPHHDQTPNPQGAKRLPPEALDERKQPYDPAPPSPEEVAQVYAFKYGLPYEDIK